MKKSIISFLGLISISNYIYANPQLASTPVAIEPPISLTTKQGQIEVKTNEKTLSVSKAPNSPLINTVTSISKPVEETTAVQKVQSSSEENRIDTSDITNSLSQADLDYIKAVNESEKRTNIESKITNNEAISKDELRILRKTYPNY